MRDILPLRAARRDIPATGLDAGCGQEIFTSPAVDEIYKTSTGIPRIINRICEKALMYSFQQKHRFVDDHTITYVTEHEMLGGDVA